MTEKNQELEELEQRIALNMQRLEEERRIATEPTPGPWSSIILGGQLGSEPLATGILIGPPMQRYNDMAGFRPPDAKLIASVWEIKAQRDALLAALIQAKEACVRHAPLSTRKIVEQAEEAIALCEGEPTP